MRLNKKVAMFLMAMSLAATTASPVLAATSTITLPTKRTNNKDITVKHTYEVFQIFTGDVVKEDPSDPNSKEVLVNIRWGVNSKRPEGNVGDLVSDEVLKELTAVNAPGKSEAEKRAVIDKYVDLTTTPNMTTAEGATEVTVDTGYYLIRDKAGSLNGKNDVATRYIVEVTDSTMTMKAKSDLPKVDKQVQDTAGVQDGTTAKASDYLGKDGNWGETADQQINKTFQFRLNATLPNDESLDYYNKYKLVFHDKFSKGITFDGNIKVTVNDTEIDASNYVVENVEVGDEGEKTWTLTIADLKPIVEGQGATLRGAVVDVVYDAHLNKDAVIGNKDDNKNEVELEYSNEFDSEGTGKTPKDGVFVFTYEVPNTKYTGEDNAKTMLAGAEFRLYDDETAAKAVAAASENDVATKVTENLAHEIKLEKKADGVYIPARNQNEASSPMVSSDATANKGHFDVQGLDEGTYYIVETKTPDGGYNKLVEPIKIQVVVSDHKETDTAGESASVTYTLKNAADEEITSNDVKNNKGIELPETGGVGTIALYFMGSAILAGAGAAVVSKKKRKA